MPMLKIGQILSTREGQRVQVERFLAAGGQGEVYEVTSNGHKYALKWYHYPTTPSQVAHAEEQRNAFRMDGPFSKAPPDARFLWPITLVEDPKGRTFGYLMNLLSPKVQGLEKLVLGRMNPVPSFHVLCTAAIQLAESFRNLHTQGLCYKDINLGGPFINPNTGDVVICDCDNVRYNKTPGDIIFIFFAAPELIRGEGTCTTKTDWHSLAVLLFYMFIRHHPLEGKRQLQINVFNEVAQREFYGQNPIFLFDQHNTSNQAVVGFHDAAIRNWNIYPKFIKRLFTRAFTVGLTSPDERVKESEWIGAFSRLRDALYYCSHCRMPNFFDFEDFDNGNHQHCWRCQEESTLPKQLVIGDRRIFCTHHMTVYAHHTGERLNFNDVVGRFSQHPHNPSKWGLLNCSGLEWRVTTSDGKILQVPSGRTLPMKHGLSIDFGSAQGQIVSR
jgi:DNA-binding helix-hairpin-helix protein with protein kinase domain